MRIDHPTIRTLAVLLTCICFLGLTGNLAGLKDTQGCRVTIPVIHNWVSGDLTAVTSRGLRLVLCCWCSLQSRHACAAACGRSTPLQQRVLKRQHLSAAACAGLARHGIETSTAAGADATAQAGGEDMGTNFGGFLRNVFDRAGLMALIVACMQQPCIVARSACEVRRMAHRLCGTPLTT